MLTNVCKVVLAKYHICINMHEHSYMCSVCVHVHTQLHTLAHTVAHSLTHMHTRTHKHARTHMNTHTLINVHTHAHIHSIAILYLSIVVVHHSLTALNPYNIN